MCPRQALERGPAPLAVLLRSATISGMSAVHFADRLVAAVRRASGRTDLQIRIGIGTREVFVGNIGSPGAKLEYTVLGPTVNLASRLEGRAPAGGILVSAATRLACEPLFDFQAVPGLVLKGFSKPYEAHRVLGVRLGPDLPPRSARSAG